MTLICSWDQIIFSTWNLDYPQISNNPRRQDSQHSMSQLLVYHRFRINHNSFLMKLHKHIIRILMLQRLEGERDLRSCKCQGWKLHNNSRLGILNNMKVGLKHHWNIMKLNWIIGVDMIRMESGWPRKTYLTKALTLSSFLISTNRFKTKEKDSLFHRSIPKGIKALIADSKRQHRHKIYKIW